MKRLLFIALAALLLASCEKNDLSFSNGKNLSVDGHSYYGLMRNMGNIDTTFVAFRDGTFYTHFHSADLYSYSAGTYSQEKEVVKVEQTTGVLPTRVFISYGDFILGQGVYYQLYK